MEDHWYALVSDCKPTLSLLELAMWGNIIIMVSYMSKLALQTNAEHIGCQYENIYFDWIPINTALIGKNLDILF